MKTGKDAFYNKIEIIIMVSLLAVMVAVTFMNVVTRYVFGFTPTWSEQLVRLLFIWVSYAAVSYAALSAEHIRVTVLCSILGEKGSRIVLFAGDLVGVVFALYAASRIGSVFLAGVQSDQRFPAIPWLPVFVMYLPGVLGMVGFALRTIQRNVIQYVLPVRTRGAEE